MRHTNHRKTPSIEYKYLSQDLILEILLRSPVKSLGRFKLVSKTWNSLISNPEFAKSHLQLSKPTKNNPLSALTLVIQEDDIISTLKIDGSTSTSKGLELNPLSHQLPDSRNGHCKTILGYCDGLICLRIKNTNHDELLYLWNPTTKERKQISLPIDAKRYEAIPSKKRKLRYEPRITRESWFGFIPSLHEYKIFLVYKNFKNSKAVCVYSSRNPKWRKICDNTDLECASGLVYMNEVLHGLAIINKHKLYIFDLVTETLGRVPFSIGYLRDPGDQVSLGVIGEGECCQLCAVSGLNFIAKMVELWILEEYSNWNSWKKLYRFDMKGEIEFSCFNFLGFTYNGWLCIQVSEEFIRVIDPTHNPPSEVIVRNPSKNRIFGFINFVENLVSPSCFPLVS